MKWCEGILVQHKYGDRKGLLGALKHIHEVNFILGRGANRVIEISGKCFFVKLRKDILDGTFIHNI